MKASILISGMEFPMSLTTIATTSLADVAAYSSSSSAAATNAPVSDPDPGDTNTPLVTAASSAPPNPLQKDISALLTDLASGNIRKSSEDLLKLKQDLKAEQSTQIPTSSVAAPASSSLDKLVSTISTALDSGSTEAALTGLSNYLVASGQGSGTVLKTSF
jgi:hypothetical protein